MSGTQSILVNNLDSQKDYFDRRLLETGRDFMIHKRFMIGKPVNHNELMFIKSFHKLLCTDNCELKDWISKKIQGKLEDCEIKVKKKPTVSDLFKIYQQQVENCSITDVVGECCDWAQIEW